MEIWAHRGCSYRYPENTLSSFRAACQYDITGIELDIQLSKDGEVVVIHDEKVDRTTDGSGMVMDMTVGQLKELRIIPNEESGFAYETIPTMREVFELLKPECEAWGLLINIELKNNIVRYEGMEEKIIDLVHEFELAPYLVYSSFNADSIRLLKELDPKVKIAALASSLQQCVEIAEAMAVDALHPYINRMDVADIRNVTNLPIRAWNIVRFEPFFPEKRESVVQNIEELAGQGITDIFTNIPECYVKKRLSRAADKIELKPEKYVCIGSGFIEAAGAACCATVYFYKAKEGSLLQWKSKEYCYQIFLYSLDTEERLIYSYCYQEEENWATYQPTWGSVEWRQKDWTFSEDCYFRITVRRVDGRELKTVPTADELLELWMPVSTPYVWPAYFQEEALKTVQTVRERRREGDLVFFLLADSHYVNNGTWEETAYNIQKTAGMIKPDAVIHLGDLTDGMVSLAVTKEYADRVIQDLKQTGSPVYLCLGNHDSNYFNRNPEKMTEEEMIRCYFGKERGRAWYYVDYPEQRLRVLFLHSFDYLERVRYGFPEEELKWVEESLNELEEEWFVLVFSHVPPLGVIHYWSDQIRNGEKLIRILEEYQRGRGCKVLAYVHGHNHAEQVYSGCSFPIISIGCNKLEDFKDKKPAGAYVCDRRRHTVTQDLWDVMIVSGEKDRIEFVRFGAGRDRTVEC